MSWSRTSPQRSASRLAPSTTDRKSTRLNSSHLVISYAVFCLKKKKKALRAHLYQPCMPDPDFALPTSGASHLPNFLLSKLPTRAPVLTTLLRPASDRDDCLAA